MEKNKRLISEEKEKLIGIGGVGRSVGCTHFAVMLANYYAGIERKKTALLEWNHSGDFERIELMCTGKCRSSDHFRVLDVDYYKNAGSKELTEVLGNHIDRILIDFGAVDDHRLAELLRCDKQFMIGSFTEWQEQSFRDFVKKNRDIGDRWSYLAIFGSEETRREFRRRPGIQTIRIPFSADAFSVTRDTVEFFETLLKE